MDLKLRGKRALVMGASAGLGHAIAKTLAAEGAEVAICSRNEDRIRAAKEGTGARCGFVCDLSKPNAARIAVETAQKQLGGLDILVANTGGPPKGGIQDLTPDVWRAEFQNLWLSVTDSLTAALPSMRQQKFGRVVLVTSVAAREAMAGLTISNGLRAGLLGLTKSVANEIAADEVTINSVLPGYTATERLRELGVPEEKMVTQIPAKRLGRSEELAALVAFLASEHAGYITGQAIACDGGWLRGV